MEINITGIDLFIVIAYLIAIPSFGFYFKKYVRSEKDFFLAGRMLPWWIIGFSIIGTNIGANDFCGAAGGAYRFGLNQVHFEWMGAIPAMVLSAFLFVPYFWKAGVYTVPEFLGRRYNKFIRTVQTILWGFFMIFMLGQFFWASGLMLEEYIGVPLIFGMLLTAVIVGFYTIWGGLAAVAMTDVVQILVMFVGGFSLTVLGLSCVGGWSGLADRIAELRPHHMNMFLPADHPVYPWPGVVLGLCFVASPAWWCCNQAIIQRTLGAKSEWDAKAGMLFAAVPKMFIPILTTVPGLVALALYPNFVDADMDKAYPWVIKNLLPTGLTGLVFAAFLAALISSVDSTVNSAATLFTRDLYREYIVRRGTDRHYLIVGRVMTAAFILIAIFIAPVNQFFPGLFVAGGTMLSLFQGPTLAILLLGIYWRRTNKAGGVAGMLGGVVVSTVLYFGTMLAFEEPISFMYISWWSFLAGLLITTVVSLLTRPDPIEKLQGLVYGLVMKDQDIQEKLASRAEGE